MTVATMRRRTRGPVLAGIAVVLTVLATSAYLAGAAAGPPQALTTGGAPAGMLVVDQRDGRGEVTELGPGGQELRTGLRCQRVYRAAGTRICLRLAGLGPTFEAAIDGADGSERTVPLPGVPSRARVSASGSIASWTTFVTGDSYSVPGGFSTRTGVADLRTGEIVESLETFTAYVDGAPYTAGDVNYWGVTVADDDRTFYATMSSANQTWLVRGDLRDRTMSTIGRDVECPSLSPDGTRIAFKQRVERLGPWELAVLDLASGTRTVLPGTVGVDDQAVWLDGGTLAYGRVDRAGASTVYAIDAGGSSPPVVLVEGASSPVPPS